MDHVEMRIYGTGFKWRDVTTYSDLNVKARIKEEIKYYLRRVDAECERNYWSSIVDEKLVIGVKYRDGRIEKYLHNYSETDISLIESKNKGDKKFKKGKHIYICCPVRNLTNREKRFINKYVSKLEQEGNIVHLPYRDTNQKDDIGYRICTDNKSAIKYSDEFHIYYNPSSTGSFFDLGIAFGYNKKIVIINQIEKTESKSFANMISYWSTLKI